MSQFGGGGDANEGAALGDEIILTELVVGSVQCSAVCRNMWKPLREAVRCLDLMSECSFMMSIRSKYEIVPWRPSFIKAKKSTPVNFLFEKFGHRTVRNTLRFNEFRRPNTVLCALFFSSLE